MYSPILEKSNTPDPSGLSLSLPFLIPSPGLVPFYERVYRLAYRDLTGQDYTWNF